MNVLPKLLLLYNKYLCKHVTARYYLYLGNVENFANHFRNAPVGGHTCLTAGEQGEPAGWQAQTKCVRFCESLRSLRETNYQPIEFSPLKQAFVI